MSLLQDIPVHSAAAAVPSNMVDAVICELEQLMESYLVTRQAGAIDIKSLPLTDDDYQQLKDRLGRGEIQATANLEGLLSAIFESLSYRKGVEKTFVIR